MRRLPTSLPAPVLRLLRWLDESGVPPLQPHDVPGASADELARLAGLGALARGLASGVVDSWPPSLAKWATTDVDVDADLLTDLRTHLTDNDGPDMLALIYEWVVSGVNRRRLGTFFTPPELIRHMMNSVGLLNDTSPAHVVDPGAGVGAFTIAAHRTWPNAQVTAVDVNVVTLGLLAARLHNSAQPDHSPITYADQDYLTWLQTEWPLLEGPRLILGNPPYTRHQHMSADAKERARRSAGDMITSGLAGLSAYFLAASLLALAAQDSLSLLLPGSWCETRYGREVRQWLWGQTDREIMIDLFPSRVEVFPGTQVTAMVLSVGPAAKATKAFSVRETDLIGDEVVVQRTVRPDRSQPCPATFTELLKVPQAAVDLGKPLGDHARVRRGVATGASSFFFLTDATWAEHHLPVDARRAALVKPTHMRANNLTQATHDRIGLEGRARWLLDLNGHDDLVAADAHLQAYLALGEDAGIPDRHLAKARHDWWRVESVSPPDIFIAPVSKGAHRIIVNNLHAVGSNNLYGIYLDKSAPWSAGFLAQFLRSDPGQAGMAHLARAYQGGSQKLEPRSLLSLNVPTRYVREPLK